MLKSLSQNLKRRIANWCLRHLFNAITEDAFLQVQFFKSAKGESGKIFVGNKELPLNEVKEFAVQARTLLKFNVYRRVTDSMKWTANEMMYQNSKNADDILAGKMVLYALDVLNKKLENIAKL